MKHTVTCILTFCLLLSLLAISGAAAENEQAATVTVTISNKGELVATAEQVTVTDTDGDGTLTVNDALYAAHQKLYDGGADAGYGSYTGDYGLSMSKLWGDQSGAFGYYLNNTACMSLADPIKDGDSITAFVYQSDDWSDVYTYFDVTEVSAEVGEEITLTLMAAGYDENWNPITYPVKGAVITMNGNPVYAYSSEGSKPMWETDENGKVTIQFNTISDPQKQNAILISARCNGKSIVPPVCKLTLTLPEFEEQSTQETENNSCEVVVGAGLTVLLPLAYLCMKRKEQ